MVFWILLVLKIPTVENLSTRLIQWGLTRARKRPYLRTQETGRLPMVQEPPVPSVLHEIKVSARLVHNYKRYGTISTRLTLDA